jgi:poly(3-hydroxybutyrate) depolymerase
MKSQLCTSLGPSSLVRILLPAVATAVASACTPSTGPADSGELPLPTIRQEVLDPGRLYTLAIPASYTGDESVPLVLALHYGGHGAPYFGRGVLTGLVEPALRELEAIIVAPDCTGDDWTDPQSEEDVIAVLNHIESNFNINPEQTLVTGYSMGGIGTWYLAGRHPDRFKAAIVVAGPRAVQAARLREQPQGHHHGDGPVPLGYGHDLHEWAIHLLPHATRPNRVY